jgi:hypothetical protein
MRLAFSSRVGMPAVLEVWRGKRRVRRLRRARSFSAVLRLPDGRYSVRVSSVAESGLADRRVGVLRVRGGRASVVRSLRRVGVCKRR